MNHRVIYLVLFMSACFSFAGETLYVPETAPFKDGLHVRRNIKVECNLERSVADYIADNAYSVYNNVVRKKPTSGNYHVLDVEISDVFGSGGGAWSGPKQLELRGTLKDQKGKVLGTFVARRYSTGGAFGGFKGTCKILGRCSKRLGKDVAEFLIDPEKGVALGDR